MKGKTLLKYIAVFVAATAAFIVGFALLNSLLHEDRTFADNLKNVFDWLLGLLFGGSCVYSLWKKDNKNSDKK